ncbi:hypothetical protein ACG3SL_02345 [Sphingomonas sp. CJ20]
MKAIAADAQRLMAAYPLGPSDRSLWLPKGKWPAAIARLRPAYVIVSHRAVEITTKPFFDGGWGYGFARDKRDLGMLAECWSELGEGMYWHGPC